MSLSEVSNILWRERQLLELLVFKLEEEQLVLASGRTRWLSHATHEVETILGEIKRVELERAMAVAGAIVELGLSDTLLRLSPGCENTEDLVEDLLAGLAEVATARASRKPVTAVAR